MKAFDTPITETPEAVAGPWRRPHQMLHAQVYASIEDSCASCSHEHTGLYA